MLAVKNSTKRLQSQLDLFLDSSKLADQAKAVGFIQRSSSKLKAKEFAQMMSVEILSSPDVSHEEMCRILEELNPSIALTPQALNQRLNQEECVAFLESVFEMSLALCLEHHLSFYDTELLAPFKRVLVEDSTKCELNEKLHPHLRGCGGGASKSSVKIDIIEELKSARLEQITITEGRVSDQSLHKNIFDILEQGDLVLRDLGYFAIAALRGIGEKNAFFLSRLLFPTHIYLSSGCDAEALDWASYLNENHPHDSCMDHHVFIGKKERFSVRLVSYRLREDIVNQRRRIAKRKAQKKGKKPTQKYLAQLEFACYVTNVPQTQWKTEVVGTLYRLRWQVELSFKRWKSLLKTHYLRGSKKQRVFALIYGRLIAVALLRLLYVGWASYAWDSMKRVLSPYKFYRWAIQRQRFALAIVNHNMEGLFQLYLRSILSLCKQKRKRKSTIEQVDQQTDYLSTFCDIYPIKPIR